MRIQLQKFVTLCALLLASGCVSTRSGESPLRVYDFGIEAPAARLAGVGLGQVRAAAPLDSSDMLYRLAYRNPAEVLAFSQSRWAAAPAELMKRRFARAADAASVTTCTLDVELLEISQVFDSPTSSAALLELRASLHASGARVAERTVRISEPGAGSGAAQGVSAMSRAADKSIAELAAWGAQQPRCKAG